MGSGSPARILRSPRSRTAATPGKINPVSKLSRGKRETPTNVAGTGKSTGGATSFSPITHVVQPMQEKSGGIGKEYSEAAETFGNKDSEEATSEYDNSVIPGDGHSDTPGDGISESPGKGSSVNKEGYSVTEEESPAGEGFPVAEEISGESYSETRGEGVDGFPKAGGPSETAEESSSEFAAGEGYSVTSGGEEGHSATPKEADSETPEKGQSKIPRKGNISKTRAKFNKKKSK